MINEFILSLIIITVSFLWLIAYRRLYKNKVYTFAFIFGSIGFFTIGMLLFRDIIEALLIIIQIKILDILNYILYDFDLYFQGYSIIVKLPELVKVIELNYECSGVVEILVFSSIVLFYPIKSKKEKLFKFIAGNVVIILANVLRLSIIIGFIKFFGYEGYEFAHRFLARIIFYLIVIVMYYKILTKYHVEKVKEV